MRHQRPGRSLYVPRISCVTLSVSVHLRVRVSAYVRRLFLQPEVVDVAALEEFKARAQHAHDP